MKKMILLFTIVCAGQLYGMEPMYPEQGLLTGTWENLPSDVKSLIITAIAQSGNNLDEAIKNIIKVSRINTALNTMINFNDLQGFTKIVHMLADKFGVFTFTVAEQFNTPVADRYKELVVKLAGVVDSHYSTPDDIISLVNQGADINATFPLGSIITKAIKWEFDTKRIEILLHLGAKPTNKDLDTVKGYILFSTDPVARTRKSEMIQLLEKAMKK